MTPRGSPPYVTEAIGPNQCSPAPITFHFPFTLLCFVSHYYTFVCSQRHISRLAARKRPSREFRWPLPERIKSRCGHEAGTGGSDTRTGVGEPKGFGAALQTRRRTHQASGATARRITRALSRRVRSGERKRPYRIRPWPRFSYPRLAHQRRVFPCSTDPTTVR